MTRPSSELVRVRAEDLEPGQRVRLSRVRGLVEVVGVTVDEDDGTCRIDTDAGVRICKARDLLDAEPTDGPRSEGA